MKVMCLQENLRRGVALVGRIAPGKTSLPVISNVLLATDGGQLKLSATNLEVGITHWIGAQVAEEGAITVPAKLLADVVGGLPNDQVTLTLDPRTQTLKIACAGFTTHIKGIDAEEFPTIPQIRDSDPLVSLPPPVLQEAIKQVAFTAADDDTRPVLSGVFFRLRDSRLTLAATNGFRLATRTVQLPEPATHPFECVIPARGLGELAQIASESSGPITMTATLSGSQVLFRAPTTELVSRLIEGKFPDFERILPTKYLTRALLSTAALAKAVRLASYFAGASHNVARLTLVPGQDGGQGGRLVISANAAEVGDNTGEIDCLVVGEGGPVALNVKYLADALAVIGTEQVAVEIQLPHNPGILKPVGQDGHTQLIMPIDLKQKQ